MPQVSIVDPNGGGDYTSLQSWAESERFEDYGARTIAQLRGYVDIGAASIDLSTGWPNGLMIEAHSSDIAFNGIRRSLCGIASSSSITLRGRGADIELRGLEVVNYGDGSAYRNTTATDELFRAYDCLFLETGSSQDYTVFPLSSDAVFNNCVVDSSSRVLNASPSVTFQNSTILCDTSSTVGVNGSPSYWYGCVVYNFQSPDGQCYRSGAAEPYGSAASDNTADMLKSISLNDAFLSLDPKATGDYRVNAGSVVGAANIGAFILRDGKEYSFDIDSFTLNLSFFDVETYSESIPEVNTNVFTASFSGTEYSSEFTGNIFTAKFGD